MSLIPGSKNIQELVIQYSVHTTFLKTPVSSIYWKSLSQKSVGLSSANKSSMALISLSLGTVPGRKGDNLSEFWQPVSVQYWFRVCACLCKSQNFSDEICSQSAEAVCVLFTVHTLDFQYNARLALAEQLFSTVVLSLQMSFVNHSAVLK